MKKVYVYPDRSYSPVGDVNPYRSDMVEAFRANGCTVIKSKTAWLGTIDFIFRFWQIDILVGNWLEEVANRKHGYIQSLALLVSIPLLKVFGVKIVWIVHNKKSHNLKNEVFTDFFRNFLFRKADLIIAHSKDGLSDFGDCASKISYFPHPFKRNKYNSIFKNYRYDILIWGKIQPYKGILEFLQFLKENHFEKKYSINIQGQCPNKEYFNRLYKFSSDEIKIHDSYIDDSELEAIISNSRVILFTHKQDTVLSSGALIESLRYGKTVFGPNIGNFRDLYLSDDIVKVYDSFHQLIQHLDNLFDNKLEYTSVEKIESVSSQYSWELFIKYILDSLNISYVKDKL